MQKRGCLRAVSRQKATEATVEIAPGQVRDALHVTETNTIATSSEHHPGELSRVDRVPTIPQIQGLRGFEACASPFPGRNGSSKAIVSIAQSSTSSLASLVRSHTMVSTVVHGLVHWY